MVSAIDVREAGSTYFQAQADVASYTTAVAQDRNALELLTGGPLADALLPPALAANEAQHWLGEVRAGIPSEVLLTRPDVRSAEHTLKAEHANIGAARAQYFPSLSLTGSGGIASGALNTLFTGAASGIWSFAPSVSLTLLDGGARRANVDYAEAGKNAALAQYEYTIQTAFKEVADALARRGTIHQQKAAQEALQASASERYRLAEARYKNGIDTYLNVLDAQRTWYSAEQSLISISLAELENRISLFRTLGAPGEDTFALHEAEPGSAGRN